MDMWSWLSPASVFRKCLTYLPVWQRKSYYVLFYNADKTFIISLVHVRDGGFLGRGIFKIEY